MTEQDDNVVELRTQEALGGSGGNGGNGNVVRYRLGELERRMVLLEDKVDRLIVTCTRIDERLDALAGKQSDLPSKSYVLWVFGATAAVLAVSLVGHMFIRAIAGT